MKIFKLLLAILCNLTLAYFALFLLITLHIHELGTSFKSLTVFALNIIIARHISK
jgi:hypothetical protein